MNYTTKHPLSLGLDPGIGNTGWALVRRTATGYRLIDSGMITTCPSKSLGKRLDQHFTRLHEILKTDTPDLVTIEAVYFNRNISSCISTASVIAVAELAACQLAIPVVQVKPQAVKASVTGSGTASKAAVKKMVNKLLHSDIRTDHAADAAAAAIAGLLSKPSINGYKEEPSEHAENKEVLQACKTQTLAQAK